MCLIFLLIHDVELFILKAYCFICHLDRPLKTHVWSFVFESLLIVCDLAKIHDVGYLSLKDFFLGKVLEIYILN